MENFKVLGFGHVGIKVSDFEVSRKFYEEMLGFKVIWEYYNKEGRNLIFMGNESCIVEFVESDEQLGTGQIEHLSILVDDIEAAVAELKGKGIEFKLDITLDPYLYPNGEKYAFFLGPDGESIQLEQIL